MIVFGQLELMLYDAFPSSQNSAQVGNKKNTKVSHKIVFNSIYDWVDKRNAVTKVKNHPKNPGLINKKIHDSKHIYARRNNNKPQNHLERSRALCYAQKPHIYNRNASILASGDQL